MLGLTKPDVGGKSINDQIQYIAEIEITGKSLTSASVSVGNDKQTVAEKLYRYGYSIVSETNGETVYLSRTGDFFRAYYFDNNGYVVKMKAYSNMKFITEEN